MFVKNGLIVSKILVFFFIVNNCTFSFICRAAVVDPFYATGIDLCYDCS